MSLRERLLGVERAARNRFTAEALRPSLRRHARELREELASRKKVKGPRAAEGHQERPRSAGAGGRS